MTNFSQVHLGFRVYLQDEFSTPVSRITDTVYKLKREFTAYQDTLRAARDVSLGVAAAGAMASRGLLASVREGAQFHYLMRNVKVIAGATEEELQKLKKTALNIGRETMFMPEDIASGMRFMAMAGQKTKDILNSIGPAAGLAAISLVQLGGKMGTADILTNYLKAFGLTAEHSGQMADILSTAVTNANVSLTDLGNSVRYVAATSRNLRIPMEETIGMLMALGNAGIQGSMAGTALENMYRYLTMALSERATRKQRWALEQLNLTIQDLTDSATGAYLPMDKVLAIFRDRLVGMDPLTAQNVVKEIFGVRGQRGGMTLVRQVDDVSRFIRLLTSPEIQGSTVLKMNEIMEELEGHFLKVISAVKTLKAALARAVAPSLIPIFKAIKGILAGLERFAETDVGGVLFRIAAGMIVVSTAINTVRAAFAGFVLLNRRLTTSFSGLWSAVRVGMGMTFNPAGPTHMGYIQNAVKTTPGLRWSEKRQMFYKVGPHGGARWYSRAQIPTIIEGSLQGAGKFGAFRIAGGQMLKGLGSGLLSLMGGLPGILFTIGLSVLPSLIGKISDWISASRDNTEALKQNTDSITKRDLFFLLTDSKASFSSIINKLSEMLYTNQLQVDQLKEVVEQGETLRFLLNAGLLNTEPEKLPATRVAQ